MHTLNCFIKTSVKIDKCSVLIFFEERNLLLVTQIENCSNSYNCTWKGLKILSKFLEHITSHSQKDLKINLLLNNEAVLGQLEGIYTIRYEEAFKIKRSIKPFLERIRKYDSFPERVSILIQNTLKNIPNFPIVNFYKISDNSLVLAKSVKFKEKQSRNTLF